MMMMIVWIDLVICDSLVLFIFGEVYLDDEEGDGIFGVVVDGVYVFNNFFLGWCVCLGWCCCSCGRYDGG